MACPSQYTPITLFVDPGASNSIQSAGKQHSSQQLSVLLMSFIHYRLFQFITLVHCMRDKSKIALFDRQFVYFVPKSIGVFQAILERQTLWFFQNNAARLSSPSNLRTSPEQMRLTIGSPKRSRNSPTEKLVVNIVPKFLFIRESMIR